MHPAAAAYFVALLVLGTTTAHAVCADDFRSFPEDGEVDVPTNLTSVRWDFRRCTTVDVVVVDENEQPVDTGIYSGGLRASIRGEALEAGATYRVDVTPADQFGAIEDVISFQFTAGESPLMEDFGGFTNPTVRVDHSRDRVGFVMTADLEPDHGYNALDMFDGVLVDWVRSSDEPKDNAELSYFTENGRRDECVQVRYSAPGGLVVDQDEGTFNVLDACWTGCRSNVSMAFCGVFVLFAPLFRIRRKKC